MKVHHFEQPPSVEEYTFDDLEKDREAYRRNRIERYKKAAQEAQDEAEREYQTGRALEYEQMDESKLRREFLNNFPAKLPGGAGRGFKQMQDNIKSGDLNAEIDRERAETQLEKDIDALIEKLGLTTEEVARWRQEAQERSRNWERVSSEERKYRYDIYEKLYMMMRNRGYDHSELWR